MIDAAQELFYAEGYRAVGVDRLAARAGVSKRTLYKEFETKDALLLGMLDDRGPGLAVALLPPEDDGTAPFGRIRAVFANQQHGSVDWTKGCVFVDIAVEMRDPGHPAVVSAARFKGELTAFFARQAEAGGAADPAGLAEQLTILFNGAAVQTMLSGAYPDSTHGAVDALLAAQR